MTNTQKEQIEDVLNGFDFNSAYRIALRFTRYNKDLSPESMRNTAKELLETVIENKARIGFLGYFFVVNTEEILELHSTFNHSHALKENYAKIGSKKKTPKTFDEAFSTFINSLIGE